MKTLTMVFDKKVNNEKTMIETNTNNFSGNKTRKVFFTKGEFSKREAQVILDMVYLSANPKETTSITHNGEKIEIINL